ncbi:MAG: hypothetical protein QT02_C0001G0103 [archaeon GW2011_AR9]|nr:MAG: hypothetical protein QT02_C0001G0103 [archaeon GW2011_AR9]MBS3120186.1 hypothetical protein [Candidatus Woesearchaeota archaeon]HIG93304.1 hypothetical protein [Candidatus Woesearchaeota archaeon]HIH13324.1 hypothetical protein [Candidatus Woesearchaeota archaeon]
MYYVDRVQAQGAKQRKIPVPKKFWRDFSLDCFVKIELINDPAMFFVDTVQAQGKIQRRIPVPQKFWNQFSIGSMVKVEFMRKEKKA